MKTRLIKRLWNGLASIRDHEMEDAKKKGGLVLKFEGQKMTIPLDKLDKLSFQAHKTKIQSKINPNQTYELIDIKFTPDI